MDISLRLSECCLVLEVLKKVSEEEPATVPVSLVVATATLVEDEARCIISSVTESNSTPGDVFVSLQIFAEPVTLKVSGLVLSVENAVATGIAISGMEANLLLFTELEVPEAEEQLPVDDVEGTRVSIEE